MVNAKAQRLSVAGVTLLAALILAFVSSPPAHALLEDGSLATVGSDVDQVGSTLQTQIDQTTGTVNQVGSGLGLPSVSSPQLPSTSELPVVGSGGGDLPIVGGPGGGSPGTGGGGAGGGSPGSTSGAGKGGVASTSSAGKGPGARSATALAPGSDVGVAGSVAAKHTAGARKTLGSTPGESSKDHGGGAAGAGSDGSGDGAISGGERHRPFIVARLFEQIPSEYRIALAMLALISAIFAFISAREHRRSRQAQRDALRDPLTGLANRQAFDLRFVGEWKRAERYDRPLGLLLFDLDGFKEINDSRGHAEGDRVLKKAAAALDERGLRSSDLAARLGGDEFVLLCPETGASDLEQLAGLMERSFADIGVEVSIGFAEREPGDPGPASVLERADASMYRRKADRRAARATASAHETDAAEQLAASAAA